MKVFKYRLEPVSRYQRVLMPAGAEILTVQKQGMDPCIWAMVDDKAHRDFRMFRVYGTGHEMDALEGETHKYLGTVQYEEGALIFHVFEIVPLKSSETH